jgi:aspartate/methionine/tyrosine aminotransferase
MLNSRSRMDSIQAPIIAVIGDVIRQHPGTISLGQGVVHYGPPEAALDAARAALSDPETHGYQDGDGIPQLLAAIDAKLRRDNGIRLRATAPSDASARQVSGYRVMVTAGGNMAFVHAILAITQPGDEVILPVPFYFNHEMAIQMADCTAVLVPTDDRYQLNLDAIRRAITPRTRAIVTVTPNNPTGAVFPEAPLREVNDLCARHGLFHISDEVYEYFTYGSAAHVSPGAFDGAQAHTISLFSLSKAYGFAGWRIGYMVYPERLRDALAKVQDTVLVCPPVLSQIAAVAAMEVGPAYCRQHLQSFAEVRDIVLSELRALEPLCTVPPAEGAFYCFLRVNADADPFTIAERLIREHGVAVVPGHAFGATNGCFFRIAYGALQKATVTEGIGRLVNGLRVLLEKVKS